jgi:hypothetical protein
VRRLAVALTAITCLLGIAGLVSWGVASAWYRDDMCELAQWKCDWGVYGLVGAIVGAFATAIGVIVTFVAWVAVYLLDRREAA